jgi:hypothetical protein
MALVCLAACLFLAGSRRSCREGTLKATSWSVWLNIATMALLVFVPAIAAI